MATTTTFGTHSENTSSVNKLTGYVKWFNNKAGYGFITVMDGNTSGSDIFAHHSGINGVNQYRYLVQGEYVEFVCSPTQKETHDIQAVNISGIKGGKLMYETLNDMKVTKNSYMSSSSKTVEQQSPQNKSEDSDKKGWTLVSNQEEVEESKDKKVEKNAGAGRGAGRGSGAGRGAGAGAGRG